MKKFLSAALSLTLALSLAACSSGTSGNGSSSNTSNSNSGSSNTQNAQYVIKLCHEQVDGDPSRRCRSAPPSALGRKSGEPIAL